MSSGAGRAVQRCPCQGHPVDELHVTAGDRLGVHQAAFQDDPAVARCQAGDPVVTAPERHVASHHRQAPARAECPRRRLGAGDRAQHEPSRMRPRAAAEAHRGEIERADRALRVAGETEGDVRGEGGMQRGRQQRGGFARRPRRSPEGFPPAAATTPRCRGHGLRGSDASARTRSRVPNSGITRRPASPAAAPVPCP